MVFASSSSAHYSTSHRGSSSSDIDVESGSSSTATVARRMSHSSAASDKSPAATRPQLHTLPAVSNLINDDGKNDTRKKKSQRPSWSCTECTRRKIKCKFLSSSTIFGSLGGGHSSFVPKAPSNMLHSTGDRIVPGCNQCQRRNKVHLCRLEIDDGVGFPTNGEQGIDADDAEGETSTTNGGPQMTRLATPSEYGALTSTVNAIRQRLFHLEQVLHNFTPHPDSDGQLYYAFPSGMSLQIPARTSSSADAAMAMSTTTAPNRAVNSSIGNQPVRSVVSASSYTLPSAIDRIREEGRATDSDGEVEAAVTLEFLALGRDRKQDHNSRSELRRPAEEDEEEEEPIISAVELTRGSSTWPSPNGPIRSVNANEPSSPQLGPDAPSRLSDLLPNRDLSDAIVSWSLDRVLWQHAAVHTESFLSECNEFFTWGTRRAKMVNQAWLACYFAVLCVGVKHMSEDQARICGLSPDEHKRLPKLYFDASVDALHRANFLAKHSLFSVQCVVILVVACQDVGGSDLIATLLACAIRVAQHLNIHRLPSDAEWETRRRNNAIDPHSEQGIKQLIDREIRKRLWCALSTEDWVSVPYRRSYAIFPSHFSTPLPANVHDSDLARGDFIAQDPSVPTTVTKLIMAFKVASCIRHFFEDVNSSGGLSFDLCLETDRKIRQVMSSGPKFLRPDANIDALPVFVSWMQHYWILSVSHKLLIVHRVFLGRAFRDPRYNYSRKAAIEAARGIIHQLVKGSHLPYQHVWTVPYHTIVAATTLILDIFQSSTSDPNDQVLIKRKEVEMAIEELSRLAEDSAIAARGVQLLSTLLAEEAKHRSSAMSRKRKVPPTNEIEKSGPVTKKVVTTSPTQQSSGAVVLSPSSSTTGQLSSSDLPSYYAAHDSPLGGAASVRSEGSLTQDAFDSILMEGLGAHFGSNSMTLVGAGPYNPNETEESPSMLPNVDFWRMLDASFEPVAESGFGTPSASGALGSGSGGEMMMSFGGNGASPWD